MLQSGPMLAPRAVLASTLPGLLLLASSCFTGEATLGGYCVADSDCGADQSCTNNVCGLCGNGSIDEGEVCFGASTDREVFGDVASMVPLDYDGDGDLDVVAAVNSMCMGDGMPEPCWRLYVVLNENGAEDRTVIQDESAADNGTVDTLIVDDLRGDGSLGFALAIREINAVVVALDTADNVQVIQLNDSPRTMTTSDVDGDGDIDLIVGAQSQPQIYVLLNDGQGTFSDPIISPAPMGARIPPRPLDMTGDGLVDLVAVGSAAASVGLLANDGDGSFSQVASASLDSSGFPTFVTVGDVDGDDDVDVVVTDPDLNVAYVLRSDGTVPFADQSVVQTGNNPTYAVIDDLNGDGLADLLISNTGEDNLSYYINRDGAFPDELVLDVSVSPQTALRADFNGDGVNDIIIANRNETVSLLVAEP